MKKRNYFGKFLAIAMVFAGFSLTSCDENDNAIINGEVWVKPEIQLVDGGAVVKASTISDINRMIGRLMEDVAESANAGETFTISIESPALDATESEHTVIIPTLKDADIVLNFTNPISTDAPLLIQGLGATDDSSPSTSASEVEINFASGTSGIDLNLNMPTSTVTLKGGTINELTAKTALSTLIIENGVTVNWLKLIDGDDGPSGAVVKDGGKVLGALMDDDFEVQKEGIHIDNLYKNEIPASPTVDDYYYVNNAKIIKKDNGGIVNLSIGRYEEAPEKEAEIIITDGARAYVYDNYYGGNYFPAVYIKGEGDAKIMTTGYVGGDEKVYPNNTGFYLYSIKKLSDVTVDVASVLLRNDETDMYEEVELEEGIDDIDLYLPQNAENCEFITIDRISGTDPYWYSGYYLNNKIASSTYKNCKITLKCEETAGSLRVTYPSQTDDRTGFKLIFDTCELNNVLFSTRFENSSWEDYDDFKAYIELNNSKLDGKAITKDTDLIQSVQNISKWDPEEEKTIYTTATFYTIDGTTYEPVWNQNKNRWQLIPIE